MLLLFFLNLLQYELFDIFFFQIWITGDLIIAILSLILHRYFVVLQEKLNETSRKSSDIKQFDYLRHVHTTLCQLVQTVGDVFSPLILFVFGCNVCYILAFLYSGLENEILHPNILIRTTFAYSFLYIVLRLVTSMVLSARLPEMVKNCVH